MPSPYDYQHKKRRKQLLPRALGTRCPAQWSARCDGVMVNPHRMHLDHSLPLALGGRHGDRIICAPCNTGMGAALGNAMRPRRHPHPGRHPRQPARRALPTW